MVQMYSAPGDASHPNEVTAQSESSANMYSVPSDDGTDVYQPVDGGHAYADTTLMQYDRNTHVYSNA